MKKHLKEALADTFAGLLTNIPINYVLIKIAFHYQWSPLQITILFTAFFTVFAVIRKVLIRQYFYKKALNNDL